MFFVERDYDIKKLMNETLIDLAHSLRILFFRCILLVFPSMKRELLEYSSRDHITIHPKQKHNLYCL
jgi:hypothetical protein